MAERSYTIMIVPGSRAKLFRIRVRRSILLGIVAAGCFGLLSAAVLPFIYLNAQKRLDALVSLREENHTLKQTTREITSLREQVAYFENKAAKFAIMAGVEDLPSSQGVGGLKQDLAPEATEYNDDLDNLKERSGVLKSSFDMLEKVYQDQSLLLSSTPSIAPVKGMVSYGFAWRKDPFTGQRAFHNGLDIVAPRGTPIRAPADGVVTKAGREKGYGNVIYISHGNGLTSRYAHLDGFAVKPGQEVGRGELIGYVGNTGRSLGAHLHYEILVNNTKVDPVQYILDDRMVL